MAPISLLVQKTAQEILDIIRTENLTKLPSLYKLSEILGVSTKTLRSAIKRLTDKGKLTSSQGRRTGVVQSERAANASHDGASYHLFSQIRNRIESGSYRAGHPLPKSQHFIIEESVSPNTVSQAFALLKSDRLIFKKGQKWIVGGQEKNRNRTLGTQRFKTVLFITPPGWESSNFYSHNFLSPCSRLLVTELHEHGIMLSLVFFDSAASIDSPDEEPIPSGLDEIRATVMRLGDEYLGTLVYCGWGVPESAASIIRMLLAFGKPVVDIDPTNLHQHLAQKVTPAKMSNWFRCHFDERAATQLALQSLANCGHRIVGIPIYSSDIFNWVPQRVSLLQQEAMKCTPRIELFTEEQKEKFWKFEKQYDPSLYAEQLRKTLESNIVSSEESNLTRQDSLKNLLFANTPSLVNLLKIPNISALIALNDGIARELLLWCKYTGIRVPQDISIISFDNLIDHYHLSVSTIDFGFARLGYLAAHLFIGDIPVRATKNGDVAGVCTLIDKGSIGLR